jgi:hypothetical protein
MDNLPSQKKKRRLPGLEDDREQLQCQATLVRLLSITEAFCAERLLEEVEQIMIPSRHQTVSNLWDDAAIDATRSWEAQKGAYKQWLGVKHDWKAVEQLAEARNAVAHGLGSLTRRQRRTEQSVTQKLNAAGIKLEKGRLVLSDAILANAASVCREFVEQIDLAIQQRPADFQ